MSKGRLLPVFLVFARTLGYADASDNYTVNHGTNQNITAHSTCRRVTNGSATGASVYVPTQTASEWQSFYTNPPAGVSAGGCGCTTPWGAALNDGQSVAAYQSSSVAYGSSCVSQTRTCNAGTLSGTYTNRTCAVRTCTGTVVNGKCYERGSAGQNCTAACSNKGGKTCNQAWTRDLDTGSSDSANHCRQVWARLGITEAKPLILRFVRDEVGCTTSTFGMGGPTVATCAASASNAARICGCQ